MKKIEINPDRHYNENYRQTVKQHPDLMKGYEKFNSDWYIDKIGNMNHVSDYPIDANRLTEDDWFLHLMEKSWFDANTFLPAYFEALRRAGYKSFNQIVKY